MRRAPRHASTALGTRARVWMAVALAALLAPALLAQQPAMAQQEEEQEEANPFPLVDEFQILDDDGQPIAPKPMFIDEGRRQLLVVRGGRTHFVDLDPPEDRYASTGSVPTPEPEDSSLMGFDVRRQRLLYAARPPSLANQGCPTVPVQVNVDCPTGPLTITSQSLVGDPTLSYQFPGQFNGHHPVSVFADPGSDLLLVVTKLEYSSLGLTYKHTEMWVHGFDVSLLADPDQDARLWSYQLHGCGDATGIGIANDRDFLYTMCTDPFGKLNNVQPYRPTVHGAFVVDLGGTDPLQRDAASSFEGEFYPLAGDFTQGFTMFDRAGDRVLAAVKGAGNERLYVFDTRHRAWTGSVLLPGGQSSAPGAVDPASGRAYVLYQPGEVIVAEAAPVPARQGPPPYDPDVSRGFASGTAAVFDPITRRMFIEYKDGDDHHIRVYEDLGEPFAYTPPPDPDAATNDIDEELAAQVTHTGGGSAFGARTLMVGGLAGTAAGGVNETSIIWDPNRPVDINEFRVEGGDRGMFLGHVVGAQLTGSTNDGQAKASAVGASLDEATESDLEGKLGAPFGRLGQDAPEQLRWEALKANIGEFEASSCTDFGGDDDPRDDEQRGSSTSCRERDRVHATAASSEDMSDLAVQVGFASSDVDIHLDEDAGIVSRSTAVARDVHIAVPGAGSISIGEVRAVAQTWAKGRPGTAGSCGIREACPDSDLETTVSYVRIVDANGEGFSCTTDCDPAVVADAINDRFPLRVQASGPRPATDPAITGSPGGAQAVIQKDLYAFWNDANTNNDTQPEVSGLQLILYNDGASTSRLVVQLAAVSAESKYFIGAPAPEVDLDPASLVIDLVDQVGDPLAGGMFEVRTAPDVPDLDLGDGEEEDDTSGDEGSDGEGSDDETSEDETSEDEESSEGDETSEDEEASEDEQSSDDDTSDDGESFGGSYAASTDDAEETDETEDDDATDDDSEGDGSEGDGSEDDDSEGEGSEDESSDDDSVDDTVDDVVDDALGADELVGACVTGDDGTGDCTFEDLAPGSYVVTQTAAPAGYTEAAPFPVTLTPGFASTVTFTNIKSTATIAISLSDGNANPLAGGEFSVLADDGDGLLGDADVEIGRCTTGEAGTCQPLEVPVGAYLVHQAAAPDGFEPADDVAFEFTQPGQVAEIAVVNRPPPAPTVDETVSAPKFAARPSVQMRPPPPPTPPTVTNEPIDFSGGPESPLRSVLSAPGDTIGFLTRNPGEAALFAGVWTILLAPAYLASRRRKLNLVKEGI